jgi:hypothetical protein
MPAHKGAGGHEECQPSIAQKDPACGSEKDPVAVGQLGPMDLATQDGELVTQHNDFEVFASPERKRSTMSSKMRRARR